MDAPARRLAPILVAVAAGLLLHVVAGWAFSVLGSVAGGFLSRRRAWLTGASGLLVAWGTLVAWNFAVAPQAVLEMTRVVGTLAGGLPRVVLPVVTLIVAAVLGAVGGGLGGALRNISLEGRR